MSAVTPKRIQRRRTKGWRMPPNTVYVGRGSAYGNPFRITGDVSPADAVEMYCRAWEMEWSVSLVDLVRLRGKDLACWCPLEDAHGNRVPCHADALLKLANSGDGR